MRLGSLGVLVAAAVIGLSPIPGSAHHSVTGEFDTNKPITLTGTIAKVDWINPHIFIHLDVKGDSGAVVTWALETLPTAMMRRAGLSKETILGKPGEQVTVEGLAARDGSRRLAWISKITYSDGHFYQLAGQ